MYIYERNADFFLTVCSNTHLTIINLIHCIAVRGFFQSSETPPHSLSLHIVVKVLNATKYPSQWPSGLKSPIGKPMVAGSSSGGDIYFLF